MKKQMAIKEKLKKFFTPICKWIKDHRPSKRRLIQVYSMLLFNCNIKGYVKGEIYKGNSKAMCVPGLNCYSCPGAIGACPLGSLQNALARSETTVPAYIFGILILFGVILGRTICGFLCPIGLIQEWLYKIKTPKVKKGKATRVLSYFKYFLLIAFVVVIPIIYQGVPAFCKYICPSGTLLGGIGLLINDSSLYSALGSLFTWKFLVLVVILVSSIFIFRVFCRFLCPLGAIYGFFCRVSMLGIKLDKTKCTDCGLCISVCNMDIKRVGDHECIHCGACIKVCPTKAISWKGSKLFLKENAVTTSAQSEEKVDLLSMANGLKQKEELQTESPSTNISEAQEIHEIEVSKDDEI